MPYSSVSEIPDYVPKAKRRQWMAVFNSAYKRARKDGKSEKDSEASAFAQANAVAGPNSKTLSDAELAEFTKAIGTKQTGFVRAIDGPFRCGHCEYMGKKRAGGEGVCKEPNVNGDPALKDELRDHEDFLIVTAGDCCDEYEPANKEKAMKPRKFMKAIPFAKIDEVKREVWGIVTAEVPDKDREVCDYLKSKPYYQAVIEEMAKATDGGNFFPLRYMHQLDAIGKCIAFDFRDADREVFMGFKVVDDAAWQKVLEKVLTGFSHGGKIVDMYPDEVYEGCKRYVADPSEISLVDNPCLAEAHIKDIFKLDAPATLRKAYFIGAWNAAAQGIADDKIKNLEHQLDLLKAQIASIPALAKGKTRRVAGEDLPASAFLIVLDPEKTETWNLPVKFSTEAKTKSHIRNALARFDQMKDVPKAEKDKAWKKLVALAGKYDIDVSEEKAKLATIQAYLRKQMRVAVNKLSRKVSGGNIGYSLAMLDNDLGRLAKGLWDVGRLAEVIQTLSYMLSSIQYEEEMEKDEDSALPEMLKENVNSLLDTLIAMVEEEAEELREGTTAMNVPAVGAGA